MDRQKNFSFKSTRFRVISFAILCFVIFTSFASWISDSSRSFLQEINLEFNRASLGGGPNSPLTFQHSFKNASGFASMPVVKKQNESEHFELLNSERSRDDVNVYFPAVQETAPALKTSSRRSQFARNAKGEGKGIEASKEEKRGQSKRRENTDEKIEALSTERNREKNGRECDVTKGRWVYDESYPLYTNSSCPFIEESFNCLGNGRVERDYMKWRWQPQDCDIPRFNAKEMLDLIRGKKMLFVGDSVNRNQWESMVCMLKGAIEEPHEASGRKKIKLIREKGHRGFHFVDYNCTVGFCKTHFLVREGEARVHKQWVTTMQIDAIHSSFSWWREADIVIFNTGHWWNDFKTRSGINYFQEGNRVHPRLKLLTAFRSALMTWASWIDKNINPRKTKIFFRSMAPTHFRGGQWNSGGHCDEATQPLNYTSTEIYHDRNAILKDILKHMNTPVTFMNITSLTGYRVDAHPSLYLRNRKLRKSDGTNIQDCSHWCLPGVPDTWNELLYFLLQSKRRDSFL